MKNITVPLINLRKQHLRIKKETFQVIKNIINDSAFFMGKELKEFEKKWANFCQVKYAVGVGSGTAALQLTLMACGIGKNDEIITTCLSYPATAEAIIQVGAKPVFVDTFSDGTINTSHLEDKINTKTKAILPVHLYGIPCKLEKIVDIAYKHKLLLIEDCAQAHGSVYRGKKVGSFGVAGCFSFYPGKVLGGWGDGGAVVTKNKIIAKKIKLLRDHGRISKYKHCILGYSECLDNLQAGILLTKLKYLDSWILQRRNWINYYNKSLKNLPIKLPKISQDSRPSFYTYAIQVKKRKKLKNFLKKSGISTNIYFPIPLHLQPSMKFLGYKKGNFPVAEKIAKSVLSLPLYPEMNQKEIDYIIKTVKKFYQD